MGRPGIKQCPVNCHGGPQVTVVPLADNNGKIHLNKLKELGILEARVWWVSSSVSGPFFLRFSSLYVPLSIPKLALTETVAGGG